VSDNLNIPAELKYTEDHEWTQIEGDIATIGITDFAQSSLGEIVFIEVPEAGSQIKKGESFGVVESIKSVSDLYAPLSGEVIEANNALEDAPEGCNEDPYGSWFIKIRISDSSETESLMSDEQYKNHCQQSS